MILLLIGMAGSTQNYNEWVATAQRLFVWGRKTDGKGK